MQILIRLSVAALLVLIVLWVQTQLSQVSTIRPQFERIPEILPEQHEIKADKPMGSQSHPPSPSPSSARKKRPSISDLLPSTQKDTASSHWTIDSMLDTTQKRIDGVIVVSRLKFERPDWLRDELPDWRHAIYTRDDRRHALSLPKNKGKAGAVYLQYIIDHYHHFPATIVFLHNHRKPGHTEFRDYGNVAAVTLLRQDFVQRNGFANLRCTTGSSSDTECGDLIRPVPREGVQLTPIEREFAVVWERFFNNTDVPGTIATPYCGQFAVSREQVRKRSREEYIRYQQWVMETSLSDEQIEQLMWHIIFGKEAVYCPDTAQCFQNVYGL
ncbi:hypothetical protein BO78DRAFT_312205 [Aspergillus sclerotiicarbonarius CBS 121057]|uniref:Uncharacterized protein n=1 Tax=Aspergillus sclerotiicarbonarius (strain CBS 121057 / IBT 28362) TaxID=1448318 RepID=A0A319EE07_ASPSB|nr:hypothetical protein BO78DRAFT_312205 [Aspergillus sclerotiicarbonarius CBS 121057]